MMSFVMQLEVNEDWLSNSRGKDAVLSEACNFIGRLYGDAPDMIFCNQQVIEEMLLNSFRSVLNKAKSLKDGYRGKIDISIFSENDRLRVAVEDNGTGIIDERNMFANHVYERTIEDNTGGCGTFLAKALVESIGGRLGYENKRPDGARFFYELPIKAKR